MKKVITILLLVVFTVISAFPMSVFAATDDELEKALNIVKERITIPEEYQEFSYSMNTEASRKVWYLNWRNKEDRNAANINVRVDNKGTIEAYNFYKYETYQDTRKLPKFSRDNAEAAAKKFLEKVNPGYKFVPVNNSYYESDSIYGATYRFSFARSIDGIPFYSNSCSVEVNRNTNEVEQFYLNWSYDLEFPDVSKAISLQQAQKNYAEKIGLKLTYNYYIDDNEKTKVFAAYSPMYNNNYSIDAISGEKTITSHRYYANTAEKSALMDASMGGTGGKAVVLTPEELDAVENSAKLLSQEEAEALARSFKPLELTSDFTVRYSRLEKNYYQKGEYQWSLDFTNEAKVAETKTDNYRYASITLNAATGEIKSFYTYFPTSSNEPVYNKEASKAKVEDLLKEISLDKFSNSKYDENTDSYTIYEQEENQSRYSFRYLRQVNGIEFTGNYINAEFDAINGKISSLSINWFEADFPAIDKVISIEEANKILLNDIGLELNYTLQYDNEIYLKYGTSEDQKPKVKLVYSLKNTKPTLIDANSGIIINSNAEPFKDNKPIEYADVQGHFAEKQINILSQFGIALEGTEFKPDSTITQMDYLYLLVKGISGYYSQYPESEKEISAMYSELIKLGVVKEAEKAPASTVSRQDAVKFMIRALKYDKIADVKDIFKCDFIDAEAIDSSLIGYVAIASGLKIIQGSDGYFSPVASLTKAEAMVMIYNYLSN